MKKSLLVICLIASWWLVFRETSVRVESFGEVMIKDCIVANRILDRAELNKEEFKSAFDEINKKYNLEPTLEFDDHYKTHNTFGKYIGPNLLIEIRFLGCKIGYIKYEPNVLTNPIISSETYLDESVVLNIFDWLNTRNTKYSGNLT